MVFFVYLLLHKVSMLKKMVVTFNQNYWNLAHAKTSFFVAKCSVHTFIIQGLHLIAMVVNKNMQKIILAYFSLLVANFLSSKENNYEWCYDARTIDACPLEAWPSAG